MLWILVDIFDFLIRSVASSNNIVFRYKFGSRKSQEEIERDKEQLHSSLFEEPQQ